MRSPLFSTTSLFLNFHRPQTKLAKVMFLHLSVSHSVHGGLHLGEGGWVDPPPSGTIGYSQQVGGTHPTGMHSCVHNFHFEKTTYPARLLTVCVVATTRCQQVGWVPPSRDLGPEIPTPYPLWTELLADVCEKFWALRVKSGDTFLIEV